MLLKGVLLVPVYVFIFGIVPIYLFIFGALTIAGGVMGFVKAKSRPSLIAGGICGLLLLACGYLTTHPQGNALSSQNAIRGGFVMSAVLAVRFIGAFRRSGKIMPAVPMIVLGLIGSALTLGALLIAIPD